MSYDTLFNYLYYIFLIVCCSYAIFKGSLYEYIGASIMLIGSLVTYIVASGFDTSWTDLEVGIFIVDLIALAALIHLTIISDRFWPMWSTAFHLLAVTVHAAMLVAPEVTPWAFATGATFWAYPMLLALAIGSNEYVKPVDRRESRSG